MQVLRATNATIKLFARSLCKWSWYDEPINRLWSEEINKFSALVMIIKHFKLGPGSGHWSPKFTAPTQPSRTSCKTGLDKAIYYGLNTIFHLTTLTLTIPLLLSLILGTASSMSSFQVHKNINFVLSIFNIFYLVISHYWFSNQTNWHIYTCTWYI